MYNPYFYYSEDKRIAYTVIEEEGLFNVYEKNIGEDSAPRLDSQCENLEEALRIIEDRLKSYKKEKED